MKWYKPSEIAKRRLITNSVNSENVRSNNHFILELIKSGKLKAKNYGSNPDYPHYLISEKEIERYHKSN